MALADTTSRFVRPSGQPAPLPLSSCPRKPHSNAIPNSRAPTASSARRLKPSGRRTFHPMLLRSSSLAHASTCNSAWTWAGFPHHSPSAAGRRRVSTETVEHTQKKAASSGLFLVWRLAFSLRFAFHHPAVRFLSPTFWLGNAAMGVAQPLAGFGRHRLSALRLTDSTTDLRVVVHLFAASGGCFIGRWLCHCAMPRDRAWCVARDIKKATEHANGLR